MGWPFTSVINQPQGSPPTFRSSPSNTAITPGAFSAFDLSTLLIVACACGERTNTAYDWLGSVTSSVYWPAPVRNR